MEYLNQALEWNAEKMAQSMKEGIAMLLAGLGKRSVDNNGNNEDVDEEIEENEDEESPKKCRTKKKAKKGKATAKTR